MSNRTSKRSGRAGIALAVGCAFAAVPVAAQAAPVNLATASPFVVLGGSTVTNTGPSVLNGDLGVAPGTALDGFGLPATVNGATHDNDGVANNAQSTSPPPITRRPASPRAPRLTGTNLGNRNLNPGTYRYATSAQLTGALVLNAHGNANAQFVFQIGSTLTTASASSVRARQRRLAVQRVLADRQLGDARLNHGVQGQPYGAQFDLGQRRGHGPRSPARPQRRGHPDQRCHRRLDVRHVHVGTDADPDAGPAAPAPRRHRRARPGGPATRPRRPASRRPPAVPARRGCGARRASPAPAGPARPAPPGSTPPSPAT